MMVMTAKVDLKKIMLVLAGIAAAILALVLLFGGNKDAAPTAGKISDNDGRVKFLAEHGWQVTNSPTETGQVRIPNQEDAVFARYNTLQKSQGYDLSPYAGKTVMRYVYKVNNFPGATEPVYATVLMYKNKIIGGDITDTSARGVVQGFKMRQNNLPQPTEPTTQPTESISPESTTIPTE